MFIQTETTPNPLTIKFLPGVEVLPSASASFTDKDAAKASPLAEALFTIKEVDSIFFGNDFVAVTKSEPAEWASLKPLVLTTIMDHFISGQPILRETVEHEVTSASTATNEDDDIVATIRELIDTRVRPAVAEDGGDIIFKGFSDGVVFLELHGACSGCPSSTITLKDGIENMLKHYVPEVERVEALNEPMAY